MESIHSTKCLEGMKSRSHDLGAKIIIHSLNAICDNFLNVDKVAVVVLDTSVEIEATGFKAIFGLLFSISLVKCLTKR